MNAIRSRLDRGIDRCPSRAPQLRAVIAALDLELRQSIRRRPNRVSSSIQEILHVRVIVHTIEYKVVLRDTVTVRRKVARASSLPKALVRRCHAGGQLRDENIILPIQWSVIDGLRRKDLSRRGFLCLQLGCRSNGNGIVYNSRLEREVQTSRLAHVEVNVFLLERLESRRRHR